METENDLPLELPADPQPVTITLLSFFFPMITDDELHWLQCNRSAIPIDGENGGDPDGRRDCNKHEMPMLEHSSSLP
jgi:hypothetical protein